MYSGPSAAQLLAETRQQQGRLAAANLDAGAIDPAQRRASSLGLELQQHLAELDQEEGAAPPPVVLGTPVVVGKSSLRRRHQRHHHQQQHQRRRHQGVQLMKGGEVQRRVQWLDVVQPGRPLALIASYVVEGEMSRNLRREKEALAAYKHMMSGGAGGVGGAGAGGRQVEACVTSGEDDYFVPDCGGTVDDSMDTAEDVVFIGGDMSCCC